jgi:hypothetical protein
MVRLTHDNNTGDNMKNTNEITKHINYETDMDSIYSLIVKDNSKIDTPCEEWVEVQVLDIWEEDNNPNLTAIVEIIQTDIFLPAERIIDYINLDNIESVRLIAK